VPNRNKKATRFAEYFATAIKELKKKCNLFLQYIWRMQGMFYSRTRNTFKFQYVSVIFIRKELKILKRNKSTGLDNLPPGLLKDCADEVAQPLCYIINLSLSSSTVPTFWKQAKVVPIHKSGDSDNPANYRPISILPVLSKILEKAVYSQLINYLENNQLLSEAQYGYRKRRSTELAAVYFIDDIRKQVDNGKLVGAVFMDLSRAFDNY